MKEIKTEGTICLDDEYGFTYRIADIEYIEFENGNFYYQIKPNYSVIDLLPVSDFQGIPGLDLSLNKDSYIRENIVPVFISERSPSERREDLWDLLKDNDMQYLNRLEWLIRTDTRYTGDGFYVSKPENKDIKTASIGELGTRSSVISRVILESICYGSTVIADDVKITDSNRKAFYTLIMAMYKTERKYIDQRRKEEIKKSAAEGNYKGRSRIKIDSLEILEYFQLYEADKITSKDAALELNISTSTFLRRYKEYKSKNQ